MSVEKKFNKLLLWLVIWWAVAGAAGLSKTEKWKEITKKVWSKTLDFLKHTVDFLKWWLDEMSKKMWDEKKDETPPTLPDNSWN